MYQRFVELLQKKGIKAGEVARKTGIARSTFTDWKNGRSIPRADKLQKIADCLGVSLDYLVGGKNTISEGYIPVLGRVAAGIPIEAIEDIVDVEPLSPKWDKSYQYCGLVIKGDSMEPKMSDGDIVIVRIQPDIEDGDIAIVFVDGNEATCKKIRKTPEGILLISFNTAYAPMFYSNKEIAEMPVTIFGKVIERRAKC